MLRLQLQARESKARLGRSVADQLKTPMNGKAKSNMEMRKKQWEFPYSF